MLKKRLRKGKGNKRIGETKQNALLLLEAKAPTPISKWIANGKSSIRQ